MASYSRCLDQGCNYYLSPHPDMFTAWCKPSQGGHHSTYANKKMGEFPFKMSLGKLKLDSEIYLEDLI